jgi:GntR family transcriptional repressor for pyruvate dehydrogenase complex
VGEFVEPLRTARTFEAAIDHLVEGIERARLRRGDRLPSETDLSAQLGISKPTLRQAVLVLERAGLLDVRLGKYGGIFVASDLIPDEAIMSAVAREEHSAIDVLRARRVLESSVVRYATIAGTEEDWDELGRTIDLLAAHLGDRQAVMQADAMFHRGVVRAAHNRALQSATRVIGRGLAPIRDAYSGGLAQDERTLDVHRRQLAAMRERDLIALEPVLDEHLRMLENAYASVLGRTWDELFAAAGEAVLT